MNTRRWFGLTLVVFAVVWIGEPASQAQIKIVRFPNQVADNGNPGFRESHRPVNNDLADEFDPEELLAKRLRLGKEVPNGKKLPKEFLELAKALMENQELLESLKIKPEELQRLREQIKKGEIVPDQKALREFIESSKNHPTLPDEVKLKLELWAEEFNSNGGRLVDTGNSDPQAAKPPDKSTESGTTPPKADADPDAPSLKDVQENSDKLLRESMEKMLDPKWVDSVMGTSFRNNLSDFVKSALERRGQTSRIKEMASSLSNYLPRISRLLPKGFMSGTPRPRIPPIPQFGSIPGAPSVGGMSGVSAGGIGRFVIVVAVVGLLAVFLWRGGLVGALYGGAGRTNLRLGPWPVYPSKVSTRADLVRDFEYLSLLCLGMSARTCHHLELADRIGALPALDTERRRDAASTLARFYEQARYAPDDEALTPETIARARRELCYLAGVSA